MAEAAASDSLPRHDWAGVSYGHTAFVEGDDEGLQFIPIDDDRSQ